MTDPDPLDEFFDAARSAPARPSDNLLSRIAADAEREASRPPARSQQRASLFDLLGGWPAFGGLVTATAAGVWIGVANPLGFDPLGLVGAVEVSAVEFYTGYADIDWGTE